MRMTAAKIKMRRLMRVRMRWVAQKKNQTEMDRPCHRRMNRVRTREAKMTGKNDHMMDRSRKMSQAMNLK